jgi:hypothetical protein
MQFLTKFTNWHSSVSGLLYHDLPITSVLKFIQSLVTAVGYKALFEGYFISLVMLNKSSRFCVGLILSRKLLSKKPFLSPLYEV